MTLEEIKAANPKQANEDFPTYEARLSGLYNANNTPVTPAPIVLRDYATGQGLTVGNNGETPLINGNAIDTTGLQNVGGHWQGTQEQIDKVLSPYVYKSSVDEKAALEDYQKWASQPYVSQWAPQLEAKVHEILSRQFQYDPATDKQLDLAVKYMTRNVLETMNSRGVLNSTLSRDGIDQGVKELMPQYEQIARQNFQNEGQMLMSQVDMLTGLDQTAYGRYQDEGQKLATALDAVMKMDDSQYQKWSDAYTRRYNTERDKITDAQNKLENDRQKITDAWNRISEIGYVDNASSIILGVPAGTLSKEAREAKTKREQELADQKISYAQQLGIINAQYEKEKKIAAMKDAGSAAPESLGDAKQVQNYYDLKDYFFGSASMYSGKPLEAYNLLMAHPKEYTASIGQKLYDKLLVELTNSMKTEKSYGSVNSATTATVDDYAATINSLYITKIGTRTSVDKEGIKAYLDDLIRADVDESIIDSLAARYGIQ